MKKIITKASGLVIACTTPLAMGFTFETETLNGSFDSTITAGMGLRTESRGCNLINQGPTGHNAPSGCLAQSSGVADQGDLNYDRGDMFTNYLKGTHELLLKMPEDITFMARGTWIRDFAATDTTGTLSFNAPACSSRRPCCRRRCSVSRRAWARVSTSRPTINSAGTRANCRRWAATGPPPTRWVRAGGLRILRKGRPRQRPVGPFAALAAGGQRRRLWLLRDALSRQVAIVACRHSRPEHLRGGTDLGVPGRPDDVRHQCQHADR